MNQSELESESIWASEVVKNNLRVQYKIKEKLYSKQSDFQKVEVFETEAYGRMLFNDDIAMLSERDEFIYHDMIAHTPLFTHPNPKNVLVIGGGDGGTVREILRHKSVEKVTLVEIDQVVIDACTEFIPQVSAALSDERCEVRVEDGAKFVANTDHKYDIVIVDSTDPLGPSMPLFGVGFYQNVFNVLTEDGICVSQAESPYYFPEEQKSLVSVIDQVFPKVYMYKYSNLVYPGGLWCMTMASKQHSPLSSCAFARAEQKTFQNDYYSAEIHRESFVLPPFLVKRFHGLILNDEKEGAL